MSESNIKNILEHFNIDRIINSDPITKTLSYLLISKDNNTPVDRNKAILVLRKTDFNFKNQDIDLSRLDLYELIHQNSCFYKFNAKLNGIFELPLSTIEVEIVYPINDFILTKYTSTPHYNVVESYDMYTKYRLPYIIDQKCKLDWIENIFSGKSEQDKVIFQSDEFCIIYDYKYNPNIHPKSHFHILILFKDKTLNSIRDLKNDHLDLLERCVLETKNVLKINDIGNDKVLMYFHYPPTFYQLHLHVVRADNKLSDSKADRAHILQNVIFNIKMRSDYYHKADIMIRIKQQEYEQLSDNYEIHNLKNLRN